MNQVAWERLVARYGQPTCPICKGDDWQVHEPLSAGVVKDRRTMRGIWPFRRPDTWMQLIVSVVCQTCGYALVFDHTTMVLVKG